MLKRITKYKCKNCQNELVCGNIYKRFYCCYSCFESHRSRKCLICQQHFIGKRKTSLFCESCIDMGVGLSNHELQNTYKTMLYRCYNPERNGHESYSGKNITVCKRWHKFENFLNDMGTRPYKTTLDRIDNDKGYSKENCRWATIEEQRINRGRFKNSTRKYKGVSPHKDKWKSVIRFKGVSYYLGLFSSEYDAAVAYDNKLKEFYPDKYKKYSNIKD